MPVDAVIVSNNSSRPSSISSLFLSLFLLNSSTKNSLIVPQFSVQICAIKVIQTQGAMKILKFAFNVAGTLD